MNAFATQSLFALGFTALLVFRFARRELKARVVKAATLWIRPAIMTVLAGYLIVLSTQVDPLGDRALIAIMAGGALLGVIVGLLVVRNSQFSAAGVPNAVRVQGNRITFAIWIVALALRLAARYLFSFGAEPRAQLPLNCGTIVMTASAFVVIAIAFFGEIRRYAPRTVPLS